MVIRLFYLTLAILLAGLYGCDREVANDCRITSGEAPVVGASSAGCLVVVDKAALLVRTRKSSRLGKLVPPGGRVESGEWAQCAAARETLEEAGVNVAVGRELTRFSTGFVLFRCEPADAAALAAARAPDVPEHMRGEVSDKLLVDPTTMTPVGGGKAEAWAYPSNAIIGRRWPRWSRPGGSQ